MALDSVKQETFHEKSALELSIAVSSYPAHTLEPDAVGSDLRPTSTNQRRGVAGPLPWTAVALLLFFIVQAGADTSFMINNFMQFPLPRGGNGAGAPPAGTQETPGALGLGLRTTNAIVQAFGFLYPFINVFSAWLADTKIGRHRVLELATGLSCIYSLLWVVAGLPPVVHGRHPVVPFMLGLLVRTVAIALYGPLTVPIIIDQYIPESDYISLLPSGETVIVSRRLTEEKMSLLLNGVGELGSFLSIATTLCEKRIGYWLSYLVPCILINTLPAFLLFIRRRIVKKQPDPRDFTTLYPVLRMLIQETGWRFIYRAEAWETVKPSQLANRGITQYKGTIIGWDDHFIDETRLFCQTSTMFLFFPIFYLSGGGTGVILGSQASTMTTNGAPNDILSNIDTFVTVILGFCLPLWFYPLCRRCGIDMDPVLSIVAGFILGGFSSFIGAILQWRIYQTSPCGYHATGCAIGSGASPISVWWQVPIFALNGVSRLIAVASACELAYRNAPLHLKSLLLSLQWFTGVFTHAIKLGVAPVISDPYLIWVWATPGIAVMVEAVVFYYLYRHFRGYK